MAADYWQQEQIDGRRCLTVADAGTKSLAITYVARLSDPNQLDPLVRELIALELAIKIAASLTESPQRISALTRKAIHVRKLAQQTDARQQSSVPMTPGHGPCFGLTRLGADDGTLGLLPGGDFSLGELSPLMAGRRDSPDYNRGLATCLNAIIGQRGSGFDARARVLSTARKNNSPARLVEMITAEQRPILLEFGHRSVRLSLFDGADIEYRELSTPYSETEIWQLDWAQSGNRLFIVHPDAPAAFISQPVRVLDDRANRFF